MRRSKTETSVLAKRVVRVPSSEARSRALTRCCRCCSMRRASRSAGLKNDWRRPCGRTPLTRDVRGCTLPVSSVVGVLPAASCDTQLASCNCGNGSGNGAGRSGSGSGGGSTGRWAPSSSLESAASSKPIAVGSRGATTSASGGTPASLMGDVDGADSIDASWAAIGGCGPAASAMPPCRRSARAARCILHCAAACAFTSASPSTSPMDALERRRSTCCARPACCRFTPWGWRTATVAPLVLPWPLVEGCGRGRRDAT